MNRIPDVELVLRDYFADDGLTAPDYVLDTVEERISRQPQRRSWRLPWRNPMSTPIKLAAGLAAVVLVAVVGYNLLPRQPGVGGPTTVPTLAPTPSVQPSAAVTSAPTASPVFPEWWSADSPATGAGTLAPGAHATQRFTPAFTFTVPESWVNTSDEAVAYGLFPDTPANQAEFAASGGGLAHEITVFRFGSPYWFCDPWEDHRGATAAEIVASLVATEAIATSGPVDVTIGGLTGKQVDIRLDPGWTETCAGDPPTLDLGDTRTRVILLDTPDLGAVFINVGSLHSADHEAFLAEAMPIVESFQFDLGQ